MEQGMLKRRRLSCIALAIFSAACTVSKTPAPPLTGPSEYGLSLSISVDRDLLVRNGVDASTVIVSARDDQGGPLRGLQVRLEILVNGQVADSFGILQPRIIATGSDGRALATYTAPPSSTGVSSTVDLVTIRASTVGTNNQLSKSQVVDIRLMAPIVTTPGAPVAFFTYAPSSGITTSTLVAFNGSGSYPVNGSRIMNYAWDWGDGTTDDFNSSPTEDHDWVGAGVYAVTLTVTDDLGKRSSTTQLITVG
jgi:hypothetical protein